MRIASRIGVAALLALLTGCGKEQPTLSGGKPVAHWVRALQDPGPKTRREAAFKLGNVGPSDPVALPALIGALRDRDAGVRREAVLALVKFGPAAREAAPALAEVRRRDPDAVARTYAARTLAKLDFPK